MSSSLETVALCTLPGVTTLIAGGALASLWTPGPTLRSAVEHFAAGVVFSVLAVELLPELRKDANPLWVALGFTAGVAAMLSLRRWSAERDERRTPEGQWPWGMLGAVAMDVMIDGLLLGIGFALGRKAGVLLAGAMSVEFFSLGLAMSLTLGARPGTSRWALIATSAALAVPFVVGAVLGAVLLQNVAGPAVTATVSFGCAALLYLVTEELLVEAHEVEETTVEASMFFAGFLLFLLIGMIE